MEDITNFMNRLDANTPVSEIADFLKALGRKLEQSNRHNLSPGLLAVTEDFVMKLAHREDIFSSFHQKMLFEIIGCVQELNQEFEEDWRLRAHFYSNIVRLGMMLRELGAQLG